MEEQRQGPAGKWNRHLVRRGAPGSDRERAAQGVHGHRRRGEHRFQAGSGDQGAEGPAVGQRGLRGGVACRAAQPARGDGRAEAQGQGSAGDGLRRAGVESASMTLYEAIEAGDLKAAKKLLAEGAYVNEAGPGDKTPLI